MTSKGRIGELTRWRVSSEELLRVRTDRGLTRVAMAAEIGIHPEHLKKLERGDRVQVTETTAERIGRVVAAAIVPEPGDVSEEVVAHQGRSAALGLLWTNWLRRKRLLADVTVETYERDIRRLEVHSGYPREQLRQHHLEDFLRDPMVGPQVKERTFLVYRIWHRWGASYGYWRLDPHLNEMKFPKYRAPVQPALSSEEAASLLAGASGPIALRLVFVGLYTGLRLAEIQRLDESSWKGAIITVLVKGGKPLRLPVHPVLMDHRREILSEQPSRKDLQKCAVQLRPLAMAQPFTPHWLRRTFSERLRELGTPTDTIAALLGHESQSITVRHYAPVTWTEMSKAIKILAYS